MATNTQMNVGIRQGFVGYAGGEVNYEPAGTTLYKCRREGLVFLTTSYHVGDSLTFDVGGTSYSAAAIAQLQLFWDQGWIYPAA